MSRNEPRPGILPEIATALPWPPAEYSAAASWCAHCDFPLDQIEHHRCCIGYIPGGTGLPLCSCPCNEQRRAAAASRRPDPFYDRPRWWQDLQGPLAFQSGTRS